MIKTKKQIKNAKKQNEKNKNNQEQYANHEYLEIDLPTGKDLIDQSLKLREKIQNIKNEAKEQQIEIMDFENITEDLQTYKYQPLYMVNHEGKADLGMTDKELAKHVHLTYFWELNQTKLSNLPVADRKQFIKKYRNGEMLEPMRQTFLADNEINIFLNAIEASLTDGIIDHIRSTFDPNKNYDYLTESQKNIVKKFIDYLPEYKIVLLNQKMPFNKAEFKAKHRFTYKVYISKQVNKDNSSLCDVYLRYNKFSEYFLHHTYFLKQEDCEVLVNQRFNYTKEVLEALILIYQSEKDQPNDFLETTNVSKTKYQQQQSQQKQENHHEPAFRLNMDFMQKDYESPIKQRPSSESVLDVQEQQQQEDTTQSHSAKKLNYEQASINDFVDNTTNIKSVSDNSQIEVTASLRKCDDLKISDNKTIDDSSCDQNQQPEQKSHQIKNDKNAISQAGQKKQSVMKMSFEEKHQIIKDKIAKIIKILERLPYIKQIFKINGEDISIYSVLSAYQNINRQINDKISSNELVSSDLINQFFQQYKHKSIENVLNNIISSNNKKFADCLQDL